MPTQKAFASYFLFASYFHIYRLFSHLPPTNEAVFHAVKSFSKSRFSATKDSTRVPRKA